MILEFSVENYRSIKDKVEFSMVAESSKSKSNNVFEQELANNDKVRLLKTAIIYGANASGKSNIIRAFFEFISYIGHGMLIADTEIPAYNPFLFDLETREKPSNFMLTFIGPKGYKYEYLLSFDKHAVIKEDLLYYPEGNQRKVFTRPINKKSDDMIHIASLGTDFRNKKYEIFKNQLLISKFGKDIPHELISQVYIYFKKILALNATHDTSITQLSKLTDDYITRSKKFHSKINELIKHADTKLEGIDYKETNEEDFKFPADFAAEKRDEIIKNNRFRVFGMHSVYKKDKEVEVIGLSMEEESHGTNKLYSLGGLLLTILDTGGTVFVDELDISLHPFLSKLLIQMFHNKKINPHNAQLIFTAHDSTLLNKSLFRKDQIWFTKKNDFGATDLYSAQDFTGVREDTPFDKWYLAGKFDAIPDIKSIESLFTNE